MIFASKSSRGSMNRRNVLPGTREGGSPRWPGSPGRRGCPGGCRAGGINGKILLEAMSYVCNVQNRWHGTRHRLHLLKGLVPNL